MKTYYLYKITNTINGKRYIGKTNNPERRWRDHKSPSSCCTRLRQALKKYGKENFKFEVICIGSFEYISNLEIAAIKLYNTQREYNISDGVSNNSGKTILKRKDDYYCFIRGFWWPNSRTCMDRLNIKYGVFYRELSKHSINPDKLPSKKYQPVRNSREDILNRQRVAKRKLMGILVDDIFYSSIIEGMTALNLSRDQITYRLNNEHFRNFERVFQ